MVVGGSGGVFQRRLEVRVGKCSVDLRRKTFEHEVCSGGIQTIFNEVVAQRRDKRLRRSFWWVASLCRSDHQKTALSGDDGNVVR
ncbi:hypothetical protein V6N12_067071 [Hibiscus sabdariffa]|uniref:Uncharacterized protein n=1 Tax=Hibiscus sabdariffa TaxID=183260 RepID=A0ABR2AKW7_9ROSI